MDELPQSFAPATRAWLASKFEALTPVQAQGWPLLANGEHALLVAPTGSGKTLAAFLASIDRLGRRAEQGAPGVRVLYISPLKALAVDVERNLRAPLVGITQTAKRLGLNPPEISVGVRSGDTSAAGLGMIGMMGARRGSRKMHANA